MKAKPKHPAIYVRISDDKEGQAKGVARQLEDCEALVAARDWPVAAVYDDNDQSAWKANVVRKEFRRLLADIADGLVDAVVVYDSDRFYRQPRELEEFIDVCAAANVTKFAQVTGDIDMSSTDGQLTLRIKAAVAVKESDDKSRRIKRKAQELASLGEPHGGGRRPYGFEDDRRTIRPAEAAVLVEAKDRVLAGETVRGICYDLNGRGEQTAQGHPWSQRTLVRTLKAARISGRREHQGQIVAEGGWPAIISPAESDRLRAFLSDPSRRKNALARSYLLSGMLVCGREGCGEKLVARRRADGAGRYICMKRPESRACGGLAILAAPLETLAVEMALIRLDSPDLAQALTAPADDHQAEAYQQTIDQANVQLEDLARVYADQAISLTEWMAARGPIESRMEEAKRALAQNTGATAVAVIAGQGVDLAKRWDSLGFDRQRAVLSVLYDNIVIGPGVRGRSTFDPDRAAPTWRV